MSDSQPASANRAVFLSYASQDAEAARRICEALRAVGAEVWFDQNELVGGDAWDAKIRGQISSCALFVPIISAATQARGEGYFRLEWKLAVDRSHLMAHDQPFLLPVVIDLTKDSEARVPPEFRAVQWTRLPAGETTPAFCTRVKRLPGAPGAASEPATSVATTHNAQGQQATPLRSSRPWPLLVAIGAAALVAVGLWQPWRATERVVPASPPPSSAQAKPLTEAQQLVAKSRKIFDEGDELKREKYFLAEDLVKRATEIDPSEATAWAFHSQLSELMVWHAIDNSEARIETVRRDAERAHALAPDLIEVRLAVANMRIELRQDLPGLEEELRALAARYPKESRIHRSLGHVYRYLGRQDEAVTALQRARELSGGSATADADLINVLLRLRRHGDAEKVLAESLPQRTSGRLLIWDQMLRTDWHGDLAGAKSALQAWPGWLLSEDRGAIFAWKLWFWSKEYDNALAAAQRIQRDYLRDTFFIGPRAVLTARVHEAAHHEDAARSDWRTVQQICDRELTVAPTDFCASYWKAWALARLGDTAGAQAICAQMQQRNQLRVLVDSHGVIGRYDAPYTGGFGIAPLWAVVGRPELALDELGSNQSNFDRFPVTRAMLEKDPAYDSLRGNLRFKEIVSAALAPEEKQASNTLGASAPAVSEKSLVVLPLENLSPDPENAFFTDGMHDEIIATLGQIAELKVTPRQSSLAFKGSTASLAEIGQRLGVANVITGSVRRAGGTVRIQLELHRASDEALLWSLPNPNRELKDWLGVQSEIAEQVAMVLKARAGKGVSASAQVMTKDPEAYDLYLKATMLYVSDSRESNARQMVVWLEEALRRDSNFMPAAKWLARAHGRIAQATKDPSVRVREAVECKKWAETTARMMPGGGGDGALAHYYQLIEHDFAKALVYAENSIRALPGDQDGYNFGGLALDGLGREREALIYLRKGAQLETRYLANWNNVLWEAAKLRSRDVWDEVSKELPPDVEKFNGSRTRRFRFLLTGEIPTSLEAMASMEKADWLWLTRRFDEQARVLTEENDKADKEIDHLSALVPLTDALTRLGRKDEASACAREAFAIAERLQAVPEVGPSEKAGWLAPPLARLGRTAEAIAAGNRYVEAAGPDRVRLRRERQLKLAELYAYLNRPRECVELLVSLLRVPSEISVPTLKVDPKWDNVREDAGFKALLADPKNSAPL
jgi:TolB-like protein